MESITADARASGARSWWTVAPAATALAGIVIVLLVVPATEVCGPSLPGTIGCFAPQLGAWTVGALTALVLIAISVEVIGWRVPRWRRLTVVVGMTLLTMVTVAALLARADIGSQVNSFS